MAKVSGDDRLKLTITASELGFVPVPLPLFSAVMDVLEAVGPALDKLPWIAKDDDRLYGTDENRALYRAAKRASDLALDAKMREAAAAGYDIRLPDGFRIVEDEKEFVAADGTTRKLHYGSGRQPWDEIIDQGWAPDFAAGNALKYIRRAHAKNGVDDVKKARWYYAELKKMAERHVSAKFTLQALRGLLTPEDVAVLEGTLEWPLKS